MINVCACLGPKSNEPHCMCEMINLGLKTKEDYAWTLEEKENLHSFLSKIFEWKPKNPVL